MTSPQDDPFAAVPPTLRAALERRGFTQLTEVQTAILAADDGVRDLRISSQTGSGSVASRRRWISVARVTSAACAFPAACEGGLEGRNFGFFSAAFGEVRRAGVAAFDRFAMPVE